MLHLTICGMPTILGQDDLATWIVRLHCRYGPHLQAKANFHGMKKGTLRPRSINRYYPELTGSNLVDLITDDGTYTFNNKFLTEISVENDLSDWELFHGNLGEKQYYEVWKEQNSNLKHRRKR